MSRPPLTWVVGAGGLLGGAVSSAVAERTPVWSTGRRFPWSDPDACTSGLREAMEEFAVHVARGPWQVAWCAGAGVTGTDQATLDAEVAVFSRFLEDLPALLPTSAGAVFLASSAGGVYAGSPAGPPYDERSTTKPLAPYGDAKLRAEALVTDWARGWGVPVLIGRIANLYGPGQDLAKAQGLISQMCRAHLTGQPLSIYVPLDTIRDYIYADDCGGLVRDGLARLRESHDGHADVVVKVLASQRGITVGGVLAELRRVFKRAPRIVLGASPTSAFQARDLRLRSRVWPELDARPLTPFPVGVRTTSLHLLRQVQLAAM